VQIYNDHSNKLIILKIIDIKKMFSDAKVEKIKYFASICQITNDCYKKCIDLDVESETTNNLEIKKPKAAILKQNEIKCLKLCSESYLKLRNFFDTQLLEDYKSIQNKNKKIFEEDT
jgi:hypothetical protein